jgi:tetratricopeptide (TPR) repeat protein
VLLEEAAALFRGIEDRRGLGHALNRLGKLATAHGDYERAIACTEEALFLGREAADVNVMAWALSISGTAVWLKDRNAKQAESLFQVSVPLFEQGRNKFGLMEAHFGLGVVRRAQGQYEQAEMHYRESLALAQETDFIWRIAACLAGLGGLARDCERLEPAARLLGAAGAIRMAFDAPPQLFNPIPLEVEVTALRTHLDAATFARVWAEGQVMTLDQAIGYALQEPRNNA